MRNVLQHFETRSNILQHVATGWPNVCNTVRATMLQDVACFWLGLNIICLLTLNIVTLVAYFTSEIPPYSNSEGMKKKQLIDNLKSSWSFK